jgi:hypothetical protein
LLNEGKWNLFSYDWLMASHAHGGYNSSFGAMYVLAVFAVKSQRFSITTFLFGFYSSFF